MPCGLLPLRLRATLLSRGALSADEPEFSLPAMSLTPAQVVSLYSDECV